MSHARNPKERARKSIARINRWHERHALLEFIEAASGQLGETVPRVGIKNDELSAAFALVGVAEWRVLADVTLADLASSGR